MNVGKSKDSSPTCHDTGADEEEDTKHAHDSNSQYHVVRGATTTTTTTTTTTPSTTDPTMYYLYIYI
jgi:hypothetical protein